MFVMRLTNALLLALITAGVAVVAFIGGLNGQALLAPRQLRAGSSITPSVAGEPFRPNLGTPLPLGEYHLSGEQAANITNVWRFYQAYNEHRLDDVLGLLSDDPILSDCDYSNHTAIRLEGQAEVANYLRARFADGDRWQVEFFQDDPNGVPGQIVIIPMERSNGALKTMGSPNGTKTEFAVEFAVNLDPNHRLAFVDWATGGPDVAKHLCTP
jgi:hypothetical protein